MQTPASFAYERATSIEQAVALLEQHGPEARLVAGGHSLLPMMKLRLAQPDVLIDINDLATDLGYIRVEGSEIAIGALVRHADLLTSPVLREHYRIFAEAEHVIADPIVRNRGTIGGSLCQADPSEDLSAVCSALGAHLVIRSGAGLRTVEARQFHVGPYETLVGPAEMLVEVRLPIRPGAGSAYQKVERRAGDYAIAAAGAFVVLAAGVVADVGIGIAAVGAEQFTAPGAEDFLRGKEPNEANIEQAAGLAAEATSPSVDQRGTVDYKRHLAGELVRRALHSAAQRAAGQEG